MLYLHANKDLQTTNLFLLNSNKTISKKLWEEKMQILKIKIKKDVHTYTENTNKHTCRCTYNKRICAINVPSLFSRVIKAHDN